MRRCIVIFVAALLIAAAFMRPAARAEVIITELMYNPDGSDTDHEWGEIFNTGSTAVNIGGWQFGDAADGQWADAFPVNTILQPQQALVVTSNAPVFDAQWGAGINRIQLANFPPLANTPSTNNERPSLRNGGQIIDAVTYNENFNALVDPWPKIDDSSSNHNSIFVVPQGLTAAANDLGRYWKPSARGAYGGVFRNVDGENHASPGFVATVPQTPFAPSADAAWSMVIMPDTQNYVKWGEYQSLLPKITSWIRDNRDAYKIQVVLQEGDIVNNNNTNNPSSGDQTSAQQWPAAQAGMFVLNGHVPYIMAAGNHDFGFTNADNRDTMVNNYFPITANPLNDPAQGGILKGTKDPNDITNAYYAFTAPDGRKMLIFSLEWEPRPAAMTWANQIASLPQYADHTAVLLTHNYLESDNTRSTSTNVAADASGQELWDNLVKTHSNFQMVFNGHFGGDGEGYLVSTSNAGISVDQMFFNTQFETMGGHGWIRLVEFLNDGTTARVRTYSTLHDLQRTTSAYEFEFQLSQLPELPGDYNGNHVVDAGDYVLYRKYYGSRTDPTADANNDGIVNEFDYQIWRQRFGNPFAPAAGTSSFIAPIPEPSTTVLFVAALGLFGGVIRPRPRRLPLGSN